MRGQPCTGVTFGVYLGQEVLGGQEAVGLGQLFEDGDLLGVGVADADEDGGKVLLHAGDR